MTQREQIFHCSRENWSQTRAETLKSGLDPLLTFYAFLIDKKFYENVIYNKTSIVKQVAEAEFEPFEWGGGARAVKYPRS